MLQRVISIANVGRFRNSASTPNPAFGQQTLIFAPNGYGKTTLCAIFRSLERGQPEHLLARRTLGADTPTTVNFLWSGTQRQFRDGSWPAQEPKLAIFDGTFVAENVHSGDVVDVANRRNLYRIIVGRDGVDLAVREAKLGDDSRAAQGLLTAAEKAVTDISGGATARAFDALAADPEAEAKLVIERRTLEGLKEAAAIQERPQLSSATVPGWPADLEAVMARTLEDIGADAEARIARHIEEHGLQDGGQAWLARGTSYAQGDDCPFCGRDGIDGLDIVRAYRALFGRTYAELRQSITDLTDGIDSAFGNVAVSALQTLDARNTAAIEFWGRHCVLPDLGSLNVVAETIRGLHARFRALADAKAGKPLEPLREADELEALRGAVAELLDSINSYNAGVLAINTIITDTKAATAGGDLAAVQGRIAGLERTVRRHLPEGIARCDAWRRLDGDKKQVNDEKTRVRAALEAH